MKKIIFILFVCIVSISVHAQLANTIWKDTLKLDNPTEVFFNFGKDTLTVTTVADSALVETMTYSVKDNVFIIQKISGQSDCETATLGKYKFEITGNEMLVTLVSDDCSDRSSVLDNTKFIRSR
jgi:hypothetical protein